MRDSRLCGSAVVAGALLLAACGAEGTSDGPAPGRETSPDGSAAEQASAAAGTRLGPVDGHDLPPIDLERVQVGDTAPDFSLESYAGPVVTLSDFRGRKDVVLVFYRGHW